MNQASGFWTGAAVITGAGSGLGAAMARRFADAGMAVVALDIDGARAEQTAEDIRRNGGRALAMRVDVSDAGGMEDAARATEATFGDCAVLCANVSVVQSGAIDRLSLAEWRWVLDVNVMGAVNTVNAFLPLIRRTGGNRRVLITASSSVLVPGKRLGAYITSKFALMGLGETLRLELADEDIGVSVFFPAGMTTRQRESSQLARPAGLEGETLRQEDVDVMMASRKLDVATHMATPEHATRHLLERLQANPRYIVSHGKFGKELAERCDDLIHAFELAQSD